MTGWIIRNRYTAPQLDHGDILGSDGMIYNYIFSEQPDVCSELALKTCVAFSLSPCGTSGSAVIERVLTEIPDAEMELLHAQVQAALSPERYLHAFRVSRLACALAERFGCSPRKAEIAGLLHDIAKENPAEENLRIIQASSLRLAGFELREHSILHAAAGSLLAASRFDIRDPDILDAIRYHNGRPAMKKLEKIIFLADHVDYVYKNGIAPCNSFLSVGDLDRAIFKIISVINRVLVKDEQQADAITESTMNYMFSALNSPAPSAVPDADSRTSVSDALFDRALEINSRRGLPVRSVNNIRELGGISVSGGRRIRCGMLVRSGRLADMTAEDASRLSAFGVRTVIDLRSDSEIAAAPDRYIECFRYVHCPLPTVELTEYQKNIQEKFFLTSPGEEKTFYLSEYLSCISMKEMYINVLTDENSVRNLRSFFDLLCLTDQGGFLFHCTSGKDRTGIVSALLLLALGASVKDVLEDYYTSVLAGFSETEAYAQSLREQHYSPLFIDEIRYYNGIGMNILESVSDAVVSRYGSAENYLKDVLLLSDDQRCLLRERFTENEEIASFISEDCRGMQI